MVKIWPLQQKIEKKKKIHNLFLSGSLSAQMNIFYACINVSKIIYVSTSICLPAMVL